jgi:hypothetical protein
VTELLLPEDDISIAYLEGRDQINKAESPAVLALQKYSTPEEFQALAPRLGFQPPMAGRPVTAGSSVVGGEGLHVGTPEDISAGKMPETGKDSPGDAMRSGVVMGYDISRYATDPTHEQKVGAFASQMVYLDNAVAIDRHIQSVAPGSPVTGQMVMDASRRNEVSPAMILALMRQDSTYGTRGLAVKTQNPGNVGNDDAGNTRTYPTWEAGVGAVAQWLASNRAGGKQALTKMPPPLEMLAAGMKREDIEAEMQGLQVASAFADPINMAVDIGTGLLSSAGREAAGMISSGAIKAGGKLLGKEVGEQVTYGALGSAFLNAAEGVGLGPIMQDVSGIIGPIATTALMQLPRSGLSAYLKQLEVGNPTVYGQIKEKILSNPLANEIGAIGERFVPTLKGSINFGEISREVSESIGRQSGPIRLEYGNDLFGKIHIDSKHIKDIKRAGYVSVEDFVGDVATNFTSIYQGEGASLIIAKKDKLDRIAFIELRPADDGDFYTVKSAFVSRKDYLKNKSPLWERAQSNQPVSGSPSAVSGQSGDLDESVNLEERQVNNEGKIFSLIKDMVKTLKSEEGNIPLGPTLKPRTPKPSGPKPFEQDANALKRMPEAERQIEQAVLRSDLPIPKNKYISTNINQTKLETSEDIIKLIDQVGKSIEPEINAARREKISLEQTQRMANDLGWSVDTSLTWRSVLRLGTIPTKPWFPFEGLFQDMRQFRPRFPEWPPRPGVR